ncbi:MAG TPA: hypothetical protein VEJ63_23885 [Planctomycetota bacterium]|nr:hypothetical protein [Planctomycetota bacterium]
MLLALASSWVIPARLYFGEGHSYYTFAIVGDEPYYADRIQALIPGTTAANPHNGVGDPRAISPLFLDGLLREIVTVLHMDVLTAFWIWRIVFPVVMFASIFALSRAALGRRRPWHDVAISAALAYAIIHLVYELIVYYPKLQGWIIRIPTGAEYVLSVLTLLAFWRMLVLRNTRSALWLAAAMAALVYLRPYAAVAWGPAFALAAAVSIALRRLPLRTALIAGAFGLLLLIPMLGVQFWNRGIPAYTESIPRFLINVPYEIHPLWPRLLAAALAIIILGVLLKGRGRIAVVSMGIVVAALPLLAGIPATFRNELAGYDRFGCTYLVALGFATVLLLRRRAQYSSSTPYAALACALSCAVLVHNATADFSNLPQSPYNAIVHEQRYLEGYRYMAAHTPEDALVLLDDRTDWSVVPIGDREAEAAWYRQHWYDDTFSIVARRRRVSHVRLYTCPISNQDLNLMIFLQRATFGLRYRDEAKVDRLYANVLELHRPQYIFWKRDAPVPRGRGARLKSAADVVYTDEACEVWKLRYPDAVKVFENAAHESR